MTMTHCVDRKVNITPLPMDHREECLLEAFDHLEPGETLQAIDDFNPEWIQSLIEDNFNVELVDDSFEVETRAGRFVAFVQKPEGINTG